MKFPELGDILAAREHLSRLAVRAPLLPFALEDGREEHLKPELLQTIGPFKIRCAGNAVQPDRQRQ